jgi:hypothetical protein
VRRDRQRPRTAGRFADRILTGAPQLGANAEDGRRRDAVDYLTLLGCGVPLILHGLFEAEVPGCVAFLRSAFP